MIAVRAGPKASEGASAPDSAPLTGECAFFSRNSIPLGLPKTREEQLRDLGEELRTARAELAEVSRARACYRTMVEGTADAVIPFAVAESILVTACSRAETAENLRADPPEFGSMKFLRKIDLTETDAASVTWTSELSAAG